MLVAERPQGSFTRQLQVGEALDTRSVSASCSGGVLSLVIPVAQAAQPRRIEVQHDQGPAQPQLDTSGRSAAPADAEVDITPAATAQQPATQRG